jgi:hypothetical protein
MPLPSCSARNHLGVLDQDWASVSADSSALLAAWTSQLQRPVCQTILGRSVKGGRLAKLHMKRELKPLQ